MEDFKFNYDKENDDLFIYLEGKKSAGAIEFGNFVFDFDDKENLIAIQILEASEVLSRVVSKLLEVTKIKEIKADIINFRNMAFIKIQIKSDSLEETISMPIPRIKEKSPALSY